VRRHAFTPQFLRDFRNLESGLTAAEEEVVDELLARVVREPERSDRFPTFYDPNRPSWMLRSGPFLMHYAYDPDADEVVFLNLFRRR